MIKIILPVIGFIIVTIVGPLSIAGKLKWGVTILGGVLIYLLLFSLPINELTEMGASWIASDSMSIGLIILRVYLTLLIYFSSTSIFNLNNYTKMYEAIIMFLILRLLMCFTVGRYLMFYLFFEMRLIPTLLIIIGWGYQPERLQAGVYLILYTLFASLPLLFILFRIRLITGSL